MFYNCISLNSLNLKYFNTSFLNEDYINNMFDNCKVTLQYCINDDINSEKFKSQLLNYNKTNCSSLCSLNSHKYILEKNICIKSCLNDIDYQYEYNGECYSTCPNGTISYSNSICEKYYDYEQESCVSEIPAGYYLNNTVLSTIDKCDIKCYNCTLESMSQGLCILCNTNQSFYPKINDISNIGEFINCCNETPIGYYQDPEDSIYKPYSDDTSKLEYTDINSDKTNSIDAHEALDISETINNLNHNVNSDSNIDERDYSYSSQLKYYYYDSNSKASNYSYEINSNINELKKNLS